MEIKSLKVLRGPNQWASFPCLEVWLDIGGELRPWIYGNPIYIRAPEPKP